MQMYILNRSDTKDLKGNTLEAYEAVTVDGLQSWWLVPSARNRTTNGLLNLKEQDLVTVDGIVHQQWPMLTADKIERLNRTT